MRMRCPRGDQCSSAILASVVPGRSPCTACVRIAIVARRSTGIGAAIERLCVISSSRTFLIEAEQAGIAAGSRGVDGEGALSREAVQIARAAGLGARAGEALAAERLHADHGADHVAVHVGVADAQALDDVTHLAVD